MYKVKNLKITANHN